MKFPRDRISETWTEIVFTGFYWVLPSFPKGSWGFWLGSDRFWMVWSRFFCFKTSVGFLLGFTEFFFVSVSLLDQAALTGLRWEAGQRRKPKIADRKENWVGWFFLFFKIFRFFFFCSFLFSEHPSPLSAVFFWPSQLALMSSTDDPVFAPIFSSLFVVLFRVYRIYINVYRRKKIIGFYRWPMRKRQPIGWPLKPCGPVLVLIFWVTSSCSKNKKEMKWNLKKNETTKGQLRWWPFHIGFFVSAFVINWLFFRFFKNCGYFFFQKKGPSSLGNNEP